MRKINLILPIIGVSALSIIPIASCSFAEYEVILCGCGSGHHIKSMAGRPWKIGNDFYGLIYEKPYEATEAYNTVDVRINGDKTIPFDWDENEKIVHIDAQYVTGDPIEIILSFIESC